MKKLNYLLVILAAVSFSSCKKLNACLESDQSNVKLGQDVIFTNCSTGHKEADFESGEGDKQDDVDASVTSAYHTPGTYSAKIEVYKKNRNKSDVATLAMSVDQPKVSELIGTWDYYQSMEVIDVIFSFNIPVSESGELVFVNDSVYKEDGFSGTWELFESSGRLKLDNNSFPIYKLYNNELILKEEEIGGIYTLHYYSK